MPNGLAAATVGFDLSASTDTLVYTGPSSKRGAITITLCNRGAASVKVRVARGTGSSPATTDYLVYDYPLPPNSAPLILSKLATSASDKIWVRTDTATVTAQVDGVEG